jgi:hypothetical protein
MSNLQSALMIIMGEISIMLTAILGYLAFRALRKHKSIMSAIKHLTGKIRCAKDDRINMLQEFLVQHCRYDQEHAATTAQTLIEKESLFYNGLMATYAANDTEALKDLDQKTEEIIGAYRKLVSESVKAVENNVEADIESRTQQLSSTVDELSEKNAQLTSELDQLKREMDQTVQEYSSAFRQKHSQEDTDNKQQEGDTAETSANIDVEPREAEAGDDTSAIAAADIEAEAPAPAAAAEATAAEQELTAATGSGNDDRQAQAMAPAEDDDAVEPDFETHGFDEPETIDGPQVETGDTELDDEIKADLEALTAMVDDDDVGDGTIPLDGLLDDDEQPSGQEKQSAQR